MQAESFPLDQASAEDIPDSCSDSCENDDVDDEEDSCNDEEEDDDEDVYGNEDDDLCPSSITGKFLLDADIDQAQLSKAARIEALLDAATCTKNNWFWLYLCYLLYSLPILAGTMKHQPEKVPVLRNATLALDEAAQALTRMRSDGSRDKKLVFVYFKDILFI